MWVIKARPKVKIKLHVSDKFSMLVLLVMDTFVLVELLEVSEGSYIEEVLAKTTREKTRNKKGNEEQHQEQEARCSVWAKSAEEICKDENHEMEKSVWESNEEVIKMREEKKEENNTREQFEVKMGVWVVKEDERMEDKNENKSKIELKMKEKSDKEQKVSEKVRKFWKKQ